MRCNASSESYRFINTSILATVQWKHRKTHSAFHIGSTCVYRVSKKQNKTKQKESIYEHTHLVRIFFRRIKNACSAIASCQFHIVFREARTCSCSQYIVSINDFRHLQSHGLFHVVFFLLLFTFYMYRECYFPTSTLVLSACCNARAHEYASHSSRHLTIIFHCTAIGFWHRSSIININHIIKLL